MDVDRLRENLAADVGRLREVAEDMTALVPTCPGWIVEDLVRHVADGYLRAVSRIGPHGSGGPQPPIARGKHSWILLDWAYASLTAKFEACERAARASGSGWPDPAVGSWIRRAAHETAIHRVDAERACPAPVCPIDQDQALDGIDEVLTVFLSQGSRSPGLAAALPGRIRPPVLVAAAGQGWLVRITPAGVAVDGADPAAPAGRHRPGRSPGDAAVAVARADGQAVQAAGDATAVTELRDLLGHATQ